MSNIKTFKNQKNKIKEIMGNIDKTHQDLNDLVAGDNLRIDNGAKAKNTEAVVDMIDVIKQNRQDIDNAAADILGTSEYEKFKENPLEYILSKRENPADIQYIHK